MPDEIKNSNDFNQFISSSNLIVVHFSAKWAEQCAHINDVLDELAKQEEFTKNGLKLFYCEAEDLAEISLQYKIEAAPTVLLFRGGKIVDRVDGADVAQLTAKIRKHQQSDSTTPARPAPLAKEALHSRLKQLINRHNVMIFMKGNRDNPRCGFSKQLIQILTEIGVEYDTFDILQDEQVRQGLKEYSDWPTYPQLYIKGELIGGLDIIKEMRSNGELESLLKS